MNMSNLVKRMDLRGAKATLAAMLWMPRAFQPYPEPRAVPSARSASSTRGIRFALLVLALGGVLLWSAPAEAQTVEGQNDVWSADMLVVEYTEISIGAASADLFSNIGGSADLQIKSLWSYIPGRDLRLSFEGGVPDAADYTLQVGDLTLEFPEESSGNSRFQMDRCGCRLGGRPDDTCEHRPNVGTGGTRGTGGARRQYTGVWSTNHQRHRAGGRNPDGGNVEHRRRRRG